MPARWGDLPEWQRRRAEILHEACLWIEEQIGCGVGKLEAFRQAAARYSGLTLPNGTKKAKSLPLSAATMRREFARWKSGARSPFEFVLHYANNTPGKVPPELISEVRTRLTRSGRQYATRIYKDLKREWKAGCIVPGLGTWREWWTIHRPEQPLPSVTPDFPISLATLRRYGPNPVTRALGQHGLAAAYDVIARMARDSSMLRPCEVYTLDDKDFDLVIRDDIFGTPGFVRPTGYFMMDVGCRYIAGVIVRPGKASAFDVDALIANVFGTHGIGNGYPTYVLFEKGTVACSAAREEFFQRLFSGQVFIMRTGLIQGRAYAGAFKDRTAGKPCSKGMIEALMWKLDILLAQVPSQFGKRASAHGEDERKHAADIAAIEQATGLKLDSPILRLSEFNHILRMAIHDYNHDPEHGCQGFHQMTQVEVQPGVWHDLPSVDLSRIQGDHSNADQSGAT